MSEERKEQLKAKCKNNIVMQFLLTQPDVQICTNGELIKKKGEVFILEQ